MLRKIIHNFTHVWNTKNKKKTSKKNFKEEKCWQDNKYKDTQTWVVEIREASDKMGQQMVTEENCLFGAEEVCGSQKLKCMAVHL